MSYYIRIDNYDNNDALLNELSKFCKLVAKSKQDHARLNATVVNAMQFCWDTLQHSRYTKLKNAIGALQSVILGECEMEVLSYRMDNVIEAENNFKRTLCVWLRDLVVLVVSEDKPSDMTDHWKDLKTAFKAFIDVIYCTML
jgi:hypothetical protein